MCINIVFVAGMQGSWLDLICFIPAFHLNLIYELVTQEKFIFWQYIL